MRKISTLLVAFIAASAFAFPYSTSFEAPTIVAGGLDGQDGWSNILNSYQVMAGVGRTGSQAAGYFDNTGLALPWAGRVGDAAAPNAIGSVWVKVLGNSTLQYGYGLDVVYDSFSFDFSTILVNRAGDVFATSGPADPTLVLIGNVGSVVDQYVEISITADTLSQQVRAWVNGVGFVLPTLTDAVSIRSIDMLTVNMTSDTSGLSAQAYYDDYSFAPVPEPASLILLAGAGLFACRRKRK